MWFRNLWLKFSSSLRPASLKKFESQSGRCERSENLSARWNFRITSPRRWKRLDARWGRLNQLSRVKRVCDTTRFAKIFARSSKTLVTCDETGQKRQLQMVGGGDALVCLLLQLCGPAGDLRSFSNVAKGIRFRSRTNRADRFGVHVGLRRWSAVCWIHCGSISAKGSDPGRMFVLESRHDGDWLVREVVAIRDGPRAGRFW